MALRDPVAAYNAATNVEAHLVKILLIDAGVDAFVSEDLSPGGFWMFGTLPEIHKPQVWVSAHDLDRTQRVLQDYERRVVQQNQRSESSTGRVIEVLCEECKQKSCFSSAQRGTVQECPRCGAYIDVGDIEEGDAYWLEDGEPNDA